MKTDNADAMKFGLIIFGIGVFLITGCAHFQARPISPEKTAGDFDSRSLTNENLQAFLNTNHFNGKWDLRALTLVAFYYQPALAEARAQWAAVRAAEITAGERPNPTVSLTPGYDTQIPDNPSPWLIPVSLDIPVETAGKRGKRIEEAKHLSEAAYWDYISQIWQARSHVRAALLELYAAREDEKLLSREESAQSNVVRLLEGQFTAGNISSYDVTQARVVLETTQLAQQDAIGQLNQARARLAGVLGVPSNALYGVDFFFNDFTNFPLDLTAPEIRRKALLNRADIRSALAEYAASQSALQLEIANQYPDVHLGPGYAWNNGSAGDNEWQLGLTVTLPLLNQNQGAIAEAKAKRAEAAAHFITVQSGAISEIDSAMAGYDAALIKVKTVEKLSVDLQKKLDSTRAQAQVGEIDALTLANANAEYSTDELNQMDALVQAQQTLGQLEDAMQSPLTLPPETLDAAANQETQR